MDLISISNLINNIFAPIPFSRYLTALAIAFGIYLLLFLTNKILTKLIARLNYAPAIKEHMQYTLEGIRPWFFLAVSIMIASRSLDLPPKSRHLINLGLSCIILIQVLKSSSHWLRFLIKRLINSKSFNGQDAPNLSLGQNLASIAIIFLWVLAFAVLLDNFGFNIAALIAGLGIGGIAIGLALQSVLGDFFASFAIGFDRPFELGDFIIVGDILGTVEHIGLKTTRLRSLGGELIIVANGDLVNARVRNYKKMRERRVIFKLGVTYNTDQSKLSSIPALIKEIIEATPNTRFDRAHFSGFGNFSLDFEVVYYVLSPDYNAYMDIQQTINLAIREAFLRKGINFAFPTTTIDLPFHANNTTTSKGPKEGLQYSQ